MFMIDALIIILVLIAILFAIKSSIRHFKGEGPCCGGPSVAPRPKEAKRLDGPIIGEKSLEISGMKCSNCASKVEKALNSIPGVSCQVDIKKNAAKICYDRNIDEDEIRRAISDAGYELLSLR